MKDAKYIAIFAVLGLALAWAVSGPLRTPANERPRVGTPLSGAPNTSAPEPKVYAAGRIAIESTGRPVPTTLFIIARPATGGAPVAVRKIVNPEFPLPFILTTADNMVGEEFFVGDLTVTARLDADGNAGPAQAGDLNGAATVKGNARDVEIVIRK